MKKLILIALMLPAVAWAKPNILTWSDNSDNETGFEMRGRLADGTWEVVAKTAADVTELSIDPEAHEAWQVFAFNQWGYSDGGTNVLDKDLPNDPGSLKIAETVVTENITRTTVTKYQ